MRKRLVMVVLLLGARTAQAQAELREEGPWYGWQVMLADAAAIALLEAPVSASASPLARGTGMTLFFMNGPVLHMAHGNPASASVSLARIPLIWLGRIAGGLAGELLCRRGGCMPTARLLGSGIAVTPVLLLDWWSARRPPRSYYAEVGDERPFLPPPRVQGWALTLPLAAAAF
jgi:hypothetical protein